jgi:site-specific recombinase XerD
MDKTKLRNVVSRFEEYLIVDHGLGKTTVEGYGRSLSIALRRMRKFVPSHQDIKRHVYWMHNRHYSYHHIVNTSIALEHFSAMKGGRIRLGRPRKPKRVLKDILTESEVSRILQGAKNIREKAIICLLAYSGMRNKEICNVKVGDIDLGSNRVTVVAGKNSKDRLINISAECTLVLIEYLYKYPRSKNAYLFTTLVKGNPLTSGDLRKTLRTVAQRQLGSRWVYPHLMRHAQEHFLLPVVPGEHKAA